MSNHRQASGKAPSDLSLVVLGFVLFALLLGLLLFAPSETPSVSLQQPRPENPPAIALTRGPR